jgi:hypothetical protein
MIRRFKDLLTACASPSTNDLPSAMRHPAFPITAAINFKQFTAEFIALVFSVLMDPTHS